MGWHGVANATPRQQDASFLLPLRIFLHSAYCCIIVVAKEIPPDIIDKPNISLCDILENSTFSCKRIFNWIAIA